MKLTIDQRPIVDTAILASRVPFHSGLYVVGPFAERVSFASQQRRAMNLAWSIHHNCVKSGEPSGLQGKDVVVVGAGLAGLTMAVSMSLFGALVTVLDSQPDLMDLMMSAAHRDIHPTINFWPLEDIGVSTNFPFFNWYQDSCDKILKRIKGQWNGFQLKYNINGPHMRSTVTGVKSVDSKWEVRVQLADDDEYLRAYDTVVFATGFGPERDTGPQDPGYWDSSNDPIQHIQNANISPFKHYIVSGTGDGGLIEVLRLLFTSFRAGEVETATAPLISQPQIANLFRKVEAEVRQRVQDVILHDGPNLPEDFRNQISLELWQSYRKLVSERVGPGAVDELKQRKSSIDHVILFGRRPSPLEYSSAPYHRLLITLCIIHGWVSYYRVSDIGLEDSGNHVAIPNMSDPIACRTVSGVSMKTISATIDETPDPPQPFVFEDSLYIRRHGATSPLEKLFDLPEDRNRIRRIQSLYADQDWLSVDQAADYAERLSLNPPSDKLLWANGPEMQKLAADYFANRHGLDVKLEASTGEGEYVLYKNGPRFNEERFAQSKRLIPNRFLTIKVSHPIMEYGPPRDPSGFDD